jgi:AcrR family transcriptional regulator
MGSQTELSSPTPTRNARGRKVYSELLALAAEILERDGVAEFTLRGFAEEAGTTARVVVHYFENKDVLLAEVMQLLTERDLPLETALADDVTNWAQAGWRYYNDPDRSWRVGILLHLAAAAAVAPNPRVLAAFDRADSERAIGQLVRGDDQPTDVGARLMSIARGLMMAQFVGVMTPDAAEQAFIEVAELIAQHETNRPGM